MKYLNDGRFQLKDFGKYNYLYLPLCNHNGLKCSITPTFNGDLKIDQHHFALPPASNLDLINPNNARNVYFKVNGNLWNITGNTIYQQINKDETMVEGGFLYQKVLRESKEFKVEVLSFVPEIKENIEMHKIVFTNTSDKDLEVTPCVAIPLYGRSADNIRDHRHVTSLLNRIYKDSYTVYNKPTLSFDERGHIPNETIYQVIGDDNLKIDKYFTTFDEFIGEGGSVMNPLGFDSNTDQINTDGYECMAGFRYEKVSIKPNETITIKYGICISDSLVDYKILKDFDDLFIKSQEKWNSYFNNLEFDYSNNTIMKWVSIQPVLRRIFGCSFLPHHDYGKGGRGWRDLWQDCLALIKMDTISVRDLLLNNFKGVRIDGSNATIIGDKPGEFKADRNNIARMWLDHGAWPLTTLKLYIENNNDYDILNENVSYFKDSHINFSQKIDNEYDESYGNLQLTVNNKVYMGTVLEHLLVENLPIIHNVGKHNNLRLMGADWNDALDMASVNGESVPFTAFYASNLKLIADLLVKSNISSVLVFEELTILINQDFDNNNIENKLKSLDAYFESVKHKILGRKVAIDTSYLVDKLNKISDSIITHINTNEWQENEDLGFYNSYYDNDSNRLGSLEDELMLLTGQVFTIMGGVADSNQISKIVKASDKYLYKPNCGGYLLNNNFNEVKLNMGRQFGFAFGHKENGAMFSHMTVMYANALYKRGFVHEGHKVLKTIMDQIKDFNVSKTYPSIPEYFDPNGRGMYPYLTGSASWLILTMIDEVFGININKNELILTPKLTIDEFKDNKAAIKTKILGKVINITYINENNLDYGKYQIKEILLNGNAINRINVDEINNNDEIKVILSV